MMSKWIKDLNMKAETLKLLAKTAAASVRSRCRKGLPERTPFVQELRPTIDKCDLTKLKSRCMKKEPVGGESASPTSDRRLTPETRNSGIKELKKQMTQF